MACTEMIRREFWAFKSHELKITIYKVKKNNKKFKLGVFTSLSVKLEQLPLRVGPIKFQTRFEKVVNYKV